jgi:hypothetical protein
MSSDVIESVNGLIDIVDRQPYPPICPNCKVYIHNKAITDKVIADRKAAKDIADMKAAKDIGDMKAAKDIADMKAAKDIADMKAANDIADMKAAKDIADEKAANDIADRKHPVNDNNRNWLGGAHVHVKPPTNIKIQRKRKVCVDKNKSTLDIRMLFANKQQKTEYIQQRKVEHQSLAIHRRCL